MKRSFAIALSVIWTAIIIAGCGSRNHDITVVSREDGSGTRGAFIELFDIVEKSENGNTKDHTTKDAIITNKTDVMMTNISSDINAIGYISLGSMNDTVKALSIDGVQTTAENVKNGSYPVARPFIIATPQSPSELAQDFISFILSRDGQEVVSSSYISVDDAAPAYTATNASGKITVAGSSSVTPIMEKLKEAYVAINPNSNIEIQMSDSTSGMTAAIDGNCDIAMASRALKDSELEKLNGISIAMDGIAIVVNKENAIDNLSSEQVRAIFTGETTTWDEVK